MNCKDIAELAPLYVSGELERGQADPFRAHLAECRSCAAQVQQLVAMDARLRDAFSSDLPDAARIEQSVRGRISRERWIMLAAAAAALVFASILGYRALRPESLFADAARDHRLEVVEHQPRHWRTDPAEIEKLAARYGLSNMAVAPVGYRLEHAKMCGLDGKPALHLVYSNSAQEFSVFVQMRTSSAEGLRAANVESENVAAFQTDRLKGVVVTAGSSGDCLEFTRFAERLLST
jgi:anti-sigma factor RsiW